MSDSVPTYDALARLRARLEVLKSGGQRSHAEILDLFRLIRLILDQLTLRAQFPLLSLFADWLQHIEIERQPSAWSFAERVNDVLTDPELSAQFDPWHKALHEVLGLPTLRREIIWMFKAHDLHPWLFTNLPNWCAVVATVLNDLKDRPLEFEHEPSTKVAREAMTRMKAKHAALGWDGRMLIRRFFISEDLNPDPQSGAFPFLYNVVCKRDFPHLILRGRYQVAESRTQFDAGE